MNKKTGIILGIVVLVLLLGGGAFFMSSKNKPEKESATEDMVQSNRGTVTSAPKTIKELIAAGIPQKCTYSDNSSGTGIQGTTYVSGGKVRGDYTTTVNNKTMVGHMIFDGKTSYVWNEGEKTGFMMEINPNSATVTKSPENSSQNGVDLNKSIDYQCSAWISDQTLFTPPSNVKFSSFAVPSISQTSGTPTAPGNNQMCSTCNSLTGDQKTQCLKAFNCN